MLTYLSNVLFHVRVKGRTWPIDYYIVPFYAFLLYFFLSQHFVVLVLIAIVLLMGLYDISLITRF